MSNIKMDHSFFGTLKKSVAIDKNYAAQEIGCVPLACPMLAGPGAMVTSLTTLETAGPIPAIVAIAVVFFILWLIMRFIDPIQKILGTIFCMFFSKLVFIFISAIGVHMIMLGLQYYFAASK